MNKLTIEVGVEKSDNYTFSNGGSVQTKCPCCNCQLEFKLSGLKEDQSITPTIGLIYKWSELPK